MANTPPRSKSVARVAQAAITQDAKARDKAKKNGTLDSFVNFAHNLGIGAENALTSSSYGFNPVTRNRTLLEWVHRGSWLGGVAVDTVADDMTRAGVQLVGELPPDDISALEEFSTAYGIWESLNDTIKWARLYGGCIGVLLIDGQDTSTPLRIQTIRKGQFRGILPLDRWMVEPSLSDLVTEFGPDLGLPKFYRVTAQAPALSRMTIHHSRVIRLEGVRLPYWQRLMENLWGLSVLERLYDRMIAFDSASTGAAQLTFKSFIRTYKIDGMRDIVSAGGDALNGLIKYVDMMRRFQGVEGITLLDGKDEFSADSPAAFGGLADVMAQFGQQLSGALQIPLVRLFGQSPLGFSTGDTDLRNYYDTINQQQNKLLKVGVTKVYRCAAASEGIKLPGGFGIVFRSLWQLDDTQKAQVASTVTDAVAKAIDAGLVGPAVGMRELKQSSHTTGIFSNITDEMIQEADEMPPPEPESDTPEDPGEDNPKAGGPPTLADKVKAKDAAAVRAAGVLLILQNTDKVLLLRRGPNGDYPGTWATPAGGVEDGESPLDAARRELMEETGIAMFDAPMIPIQGGDPTFQLYAAVVPAPITVRLNEESTDYAWTDRREGLHPGLADILARL